MCVGGFQVDIIQQIVQLRLDEPDLVWDLATSRLRSVDWPKNRLVILAIDHPARREVAAGGNEWAMANRAELLRRISVVLTQPGIDGLLATPDILEEIFLLNHLYVQKGKPDFLNGKILVGSMNRAGLSGTTFELDDFVSAYTARGIVQANLDAGKLLFRMDPESRDSSKTLKYCVDAINTLDEHRLPCFLEPLVPGNTVDELVRLVGVATAMGSSSLYRWLKLPMVDHFERIAAATTCPIVLLGGKTPGTPDELKRKIQISLSAGPNVRGIMIGRGVLFPDDGSDPTEVAKQLEDIVHGMS